MADVKTSKATIVGRTLFPVLELVVLIATMFVVKDLYVENWHIVTGVSAGVLALVKLVELSSKANKSE